MCEGEGQSGSGWERKSMPAMNVCVFAMRYFQLQLGVSVVHRFKLAKTHEIEYIRRDANYLL